MSRLDAPAPVTDFVKEALEQIAPYIGDGSITFNLGVDVFDNGRLCVSSISSNKVTFTVNVVPKLAATAVEEKS